MLRNVKIWFAPLLILALALAGCGSTPAASTDATAGGSASAAAASGAAGAAGGTEVNIAVVVKSVTSDYWKTVGQGVTQASQQDPSIKTTFQGANEEIDIEGQIRVLEAAISQKVSALAVAPSQADQVQPVLQRAVDAGIPVVLIDTDIPGFTAKAAFVGTDNRLGGQLAGEFIAKQLNNTGSIAIIRGAAGDPVHNLREEGAKAALEAAGVTVAAVQPADSDRAKGQSVAENLLTANPDLKAIYATNDEMALGAVQAAAAAGKQLIIVGFDASPDALTAIEAGQMAGSIAQFPAKIGQLGAETAAKVARGETVEKFVNTGVELVSKDNLSQFKR
jgi:ribose transport system substrate-binding protein